MEGGCFFVVVVRVCFMGGSCYRLVLVFLLYIFYRRAVYIVHLDISDGE